MVIKARAGIKCKRRARGGLLFRRLPSSRREKGAADRRAQYIVPVRYSLN